MDINVGWPGRVHDARIWSHSAILEKLQSNTFFGPGWKDTIAGQEFFNLYLLGDAAYPASPSLVKGFVGSGLSKKQDHFNWKLSGARMTVERAFGRLKGRWKILQKPIALSTLKGSVEYIGACCVLHNLCELNSTHFKETHNRNRQFEIQRQELRDLEAAGLPVESDSDLEDEEYDIPVHVVRQSVDTHRRDALYMQMKRPKNWRRRDF